MAAVGIIAVKSTDIAKNTSSKSTTTDTGTHPGVIYASDNPKSAGYPRLFQFIKLLY
jgi:hypothetical protein